MQATHDTVRHRVSSSKHVETLETLTARPWPVEEIDIENARLATSELIESISTTRAWVSEY